MALAGVKNMKARRAHRGEGRFDRLDRRARQRQVVAHAVHLAADTAEVGLHVDDDQRRVLRAQVAVVGPSTGVGCNVAFSHGWILRKGSRKIRSYLVIDSSAGAPTRVRLGEQVMTM